MIEMGFFTYTTVRTMCPTVTWHDEATATESGAFPLRHERLDFIRLDWHVRQQVHRGVFGHQHIIFQADAESLLGNIYAGFNGHDPARLNGFGGNGDIVHIQTQRMADTVHEVFFECRFIGTLPAD